MRYAFLLIALCAAGAFAQSAQAPGKSAEGKVPVECRRYSTESLCYPKGWKTRDPVRFKNGQGMALGETFYLNRTFDFNAVGYGVPYTTPVVKPYRGWAEIVVNKIGLAREAAPDLSNPVSELPEVSDCSEGEYPCFQYLGKKIVNGYSAYYYRMYGAPDQWASTMFVYLVGRDALYRLEYRAHNNDFKKYERYFYTLLASFRPNKPAK